VRRRRAFDRRRTGKEESEMSAFYEAIGRAVVWFVRTRYRSQLRAAAGVGLAALALGAYLALSRDVEEG
jgi:hypothetical protein